MAKKYGTSDLGSDWITVPRKFRGRKPTSSDTHLAYITRPEMKALGLLSQAKKMQVGPANIPSFDDSGFNYDKDTGKLKEWIGTLGGTKTITPTNQVQGSSTKYTKPKASKGPGFGVLSRSDRGWTPAEVSDEDKKLENQKNIFGRWKEPTKDKGGYIEPVTPNRDKDHDGGGGSTQTSGGQTRTCESIGKTGTWPNCTSQETCPDGQTGTPPNCVDDGCGEGKEKVGNNCVPICGDGETRVDGVCKTVTNDCVPPCGEGKKCVNGNCVDDGGGNGGDPPSLTTILKPDQTPMLQSLTNEMDLRNMLSSVLNKNNPLFKQARTRALQAMAGRGIVNSSMAEEAVMNAVMNVAMPIATRVIDDMQRVMAANVNASNAFKTALNLAYYEELVKRVDAANTWNLERMKSQQVNWQEMLRAKTGAASIADEDIFKEYMRMLKGTPGYHDQPTWNVSGT